MRWRRRGGGATLWFYPPVIHRTCAFVVIHRSISSPSGQLTDFDMVFEGAFYSGARGSLPKCYVGKNIPSAFSWRLHLDKTDAAVSCGSASDLLLHPFPGQSIVPTRNSWFLVRVDHSSLPGFRLMTFFLRIFTCSYIYYSWRKAAIKGNAQLRTPHPHTHSISHPTSIDTYVTPSQITHELMQVLSRRMNTHDWLSNIVYEPTDIATGGPRLSTWAISFRQLSNWALRSHVLTAKTALF